MNSGSALLECDLLVQSGCIGLLFPPDVIQSFLLERQCLLVCCSFRIGFPSMILLGPGWSFVLLCKTFLYFVCFLVILCFIFTFFPIFVFFSFDEVPSLSALFPVDDVEVGCTSSHLHLIFGSLLAMSVLSSDLVKLTFLLLDRLSQIVRLF